MTKPLILNAFEMNNPGDWRSGASLATRRTPEYWSRLGALVEEAGFATLFLADVLGVFETYDSGTKIALEEAVTVPLADPFPLVPYIAAATRDLGIVVTASTTYEHPFSLARRFSTLDHLTGGRIGWNIVTSYLKSAAANFGLDTEIEHDDRYRRADEFVHVARLLWEESWQDGAVVADAARGVHTLADRVHTIDHRGEHFAVRGPHLVEPSPQRTPVLFQATGSRAGLEFAGKHAEGVYLDSPSIERVIEEIDQAGTAAERHGRRRDDILFFAAANVIVAEDEATAKAKAERIGEARSLRALLAQRGIDFDAYSLDTPLSELRSWRETARPLVSVGGRVEGVTLRDFVQYVRDQTSLFRIVGSPAQVADRLEELADRTGVSGFNISTAGWADTFPDIARHLSPELRRRGLLPERAGRTLRDRLLPGAVHPHRGGDDLGRAAPAAAGAQPGEGR